MKKIRPRDFSPQRLPDDTSMQRLLNDQRLEWGMTWAAFAAHMQRGISTIRRIATGEVSAHDVTKAHLVGRLQSRPKKTTARARS